jgi:ferredoxin
MKIEIDFGNCVKATSKNSNCTNCADICPENSISFLENIPQIADNCTDCGLCLGVCPTETIKMNGFDTLESIFGHLEFNTQTFTCEKEIPHIGLFHIEHIISYILLNKHESLSLECCDRCLEEVTKKAEEANFFLKTIESKKNIIVNLKKTEEETPQEEPNRRDFLRRLSLKGALKSKIEFEKQLQKSEIKTLSSKDSANIRQKTLPNKRKLLYMALKRVDKVSHFKNLEEQNLTFISQKSIDSSCDNCSICYRICPTGALQSDKRGSKILFDALSCVKCRLCHDVCEVEAIKLDDFNTKTLFEPTLQQLIKFDVLRCDECANFFTYLGGEVICPRCKIEEEEAKALWGIR